MFNIGDKIVCPKYGVGVIENIEDRDMLGQVQKYFVIKTLSDHMTVLIPMSKIENFHLRPISDASAIDELLTTLKENDDETSSQELGFKERYNLNTRKLASGSLVQSAEVVRDLSCIKKSKSLNTSERTQLMNARQLVTDEISLIKDISKEQAGLLLDSLIPN